MKRRTKKEFIPPFEGGIRLAPGQHVMFHIDHPASPGWEQLKHWMRTLRGTMLGYAFEVEHHLIHIILADRYGTNDATIAGPAYVRDQKALQAEHSFGRKVDAAKPIIRRVQPKAAADGLVGGLAEFRDVRNLLAHYPCWVDPVNEASVGGSPGPTTSFNLYIADQTHTWSVDVAQAQAWSALADGVLRDLEGVRAALTPR